MATDRVREAIKGEEVNSVETRRPVGDHREPSPGSGNEPEGMETGYRILSYLAAGLLFYGGLGWLGAKYLGIDLLLPLGLIIGIVLAMYAVIRRYGGLPDTRSKK